MTRPAGTTGDQMVDLNQSGSTIYRRSAMDSFAGLQAEMPAGQYRFDIEYMTTGGGTGYLRYTVDVQTYQLADFGDYPVLESPLPGAVGVPRTPTLDLQTTAWDFLEVWEDGTTFVHSQVHQGTPTDKPVLGTTLAPNTYHTVRILEVVVFGDLWLESSTWSDFTTGA
jgi:hypothetical protein